MPLSKDSLKQKLLSECKSKGLDTDSEFSKLPDLLDAIASVVVSEIQSNAKAIVASGSSAGSWPIQ